MRNLEPLGIAPRDNQGENPHAVADDYGDPETLLADLTAAEADVAKLREQLKAIRTEALAR